MSTESAVCMGCFVNPPYSWNPQPFVSQPGLTGEEKACLKHLADAWNMFVNMAAKHPDDDNEFRTAIHDAQKLIAVRVARRVDIDVWTQPK